MACAWTRGRAAASRSRGATHAALLGLHVLSEGRAQSWRVRPTRGGGQRTDGGQAVLPRKGGPLMRRFLYVLAFVVWLLLNLRACAMLLEVWR